MIDCTRRSFRNGIKPNKKQENLNWMGRAIKTIYKKQDRGISTLNETLKLLCCLDTNRERGKTFLILTYSGEKRIGHQYKQGTCDIVSYGPEMPCFVSTRVRGSSIYLYHYTLYRSLSCKRWLKKTAPDESPGMATPAHGAYHTCWLCSSRTTWQSSSAHCLFAVSEF